MSSWNLKSKLCVVAVISLSIFLTYLFLRVRMASGVPVIHTLWSGELAALLRTTAKSVQLLALVASLTTLFAAVQKWRAKRSSILAPLLQASFLCAMSLAAPDVVAHCIPIFFGFSLDLP